MIELRVKADSLNGLLPVEQIDVICDAFEREWREGTTRPLDAYATLVDRSLAPRALRELILIERDLCATFGARHRAANATLQDSLSHKPEQFVLSGALPKRFESLILLEQVGKGTFGCVFRALDVDLGIDIAVKLPHSKLLGESDNHSRFLREARLAARLSHAGIVRILRVGVWQQIPFIVSEFIRGTDLKRWLQRSRAKLTFHDIAKLMADITDAVGHAHAQSIIHRDLKPSNILIEELLPSATDSAQTSSTHLQPRLMDFGISKLLGSQSCNTHEGQMLGTPAYMSPEQANGEAISVDHSSDIYSLGVILYELLCGKPPYEGTVVEVLSQIRIGRITPLLKQMPQIPKPLAAICDRCLQLDRKNRYASCEELAADLRRWMKGEPVQAAKFSAAKWIGRYKPLRVAWVASLLMALILWTVYGANPFNRLNRQPSFETNDRLAGSSNNLSGSFAEFRNPFDGLADGSLRQPIVSAAPKDLPSISRSLASTRDDAVPVLQHWLVQPDLPHHQRLRIACVLGALDQPALAAIQIEQQLSSWILSAVQPSEVDAWMESVCVLGESVQRVLCERYLREFVDDDSPQSSNTDRRRVCAQLAAGFSTVPIEMLVPCLAQSHPTETRYWTDALAKNQQPSLDELRRLRRSAPRIFPGGLKGDKEAAKHARYVMGLYALGDTQSVWPELGLFPDPRLMFSFVHDFPLTGFRTDLLVQRLRTEQDPAVMYALLICLGQHYQASIDGSQELVNWAKHSFLNHPNAGVHSACLWLLARWGHSSFLRESTSQLRTEGIVVSRNWHYSPTGLLFIHCQPPQEYIMQMDSWMRSEELKERGRAEPLTVRFPTQKFALAAFEISRDLFKAFETNVPVSEVIKENIFHESASSVKGTDAHRFCLWMDAVDRSTTSAAIDLSDPDYVTVDFSRDGYRLPTENEWEFASRAGTQTQTFFGDLESRFLSSFLRTERMNQGGIEFPLPNQLGFFQVASGAHEWVCTPYEERREQLEFPGEIMRMNKGHAMMVCVGYNARFPSADLTYQRYPLAMKHGRSSSGFRICRSIVDNP